VSEVLELLTARIQQRLPAAYLANTVCVEFKFRFKANVFITRSSLDLVKLLNQQAVLQERMFYVDKRVIIPRSYIAELLRDSLQPHLAGVDPLQVSSVLDMCTGSGCLVRTTTIIWNRHHVPACCIDCITESGISSFGHFERFRF
jgi:methylase of polypeptide subunit release factors